jgi:hypothetical protein
MAAQLRFREEEVVAPQLSQHLTRFWTEAFEPVCNSGSVGKCRAIRKGSQMKTTLAVLMLCACAQGALAGPDCRAIESTGGRLACYDAAYPPKKDKSAAVESDL